MKKLGVVCLSALLGIGVSRAQISSYFNAVTNLNPAGYWPMHEVEAAAPGDIETNYGTLGLLGAGYYPDWATANGNIIRRQAPGALANDPDTAVYFAKAIMSGSGVSFTNALMVPHTSPLTTLNPPFSVECWYYPTNTGAQDVWGQNGFEGLNNGNAGAGVGAICGLRFTFGGGGQNFIAYGFNNSTTLNPLVSSSAQTASNWYYVVLTCDANTNFTLYFNGTAVSSAAGVGKYSPDYWTPLTIGSGRGGTRAISGSLDEFAVYTNVINDVSTHYSDGISGAAGAYFNDVTNDNPVIYLRMDGPAYSPPAISAWPALYNYGETNGVAVGNGVYTPGTMPGILTNIANPNGVPFGGVSNTLAGLSGVSSFANAGAAPAYNPTGSNANFTVTAIFRGNPCDNRVQSIVGHGTNSWQLSITTNGCLVFNAGNGNKAAGGTGQSAGDISTRKVYNDGNWHQVVAVNSTNLISIYVDGILDTNGTPNGIAVTNIIQGNANNVMIGSDPTYTNNPAGVGRNFAGQICEVAFFTNALIASQVQTLYNACGVAPYITTQPATNNTVNGGAGSSISFNVAANGSSLAYQWYFNTTSNYSGAIKLVDNVVHYTNSTTANVTVTNLTGGDSGYYFVVITNSFGTATSLLASLTVNTAPGITSFLPATYTNLFTLYAGASPEFSVTADGSKPLSYQWFTNGVLDAAATGSNMVWANVPIGTITNTCIVTNAAGFATNVWIASVVADPTAPYPQQVLALNPIGYWRLNEPDDGAQGGDGNAGVVAHDYIGGNDGVYTNTGLGGFYGSLGTPPPYSQTDTNTTPAGFGGQTLADSDAYGIDGIDFSTPANTSAAFSVEAWVNSYAQSTDAGIVSKGYGDAEQFDLDTGSDGGSTSHAYRFFVRDAAGNTHIVNSSILPGDVWHHLVGVCDEPNSNVTFYVDGVAVGTTSISPNAGILSSSRSMIIGSRPSNATTNNNDQFVGFVQDVAVYNYALSASQVADQYVSVGVQPSLSPTPPTSMNASAGGTLVIPAGAVGTPVLGYTWYDVNGGTNVATGTTNDDSLDATLTVGNVPAAWNGDTLQLTVTNAYGTASAAVSLTVITTPQITFDLPSPVTVASGKSYGYSIGVSASTPQPVFYQWYNAGTQIPEATNASYTATAGSPGSSTTYYVVVTNSYGAVTSSISTFTSVSIPPVTGAYATNVLGLNPAGYWPMHEVETAAAGDTEHNYGTLGLLGTAYYPDWLSDGSTNAFTRQVAGALANDSDPALHYNILNQPSVGVWTNVIYVPHTSPLATLNPPFSVECWFYPTNSGGGSSAQSVWGQHGFEALNAGYAGSGNGPYKGIQLNYNGSFQVFVYANGVQVGTAGSASAAINQWHHVVATCDANTNITLYLDGTASAPVAAAGEFLSDYWTPLTIGGTRGGTRSCAGTIDEFAVYTNVITDVSTHYNDALTGASGQYFSDVTNDNPVIYLRMDAPAYAPPPENTWPALFNYGSDGIVGVYTPGTVPGIVSGPNFAGLSGTNVAQLSGVSSFADAGSAAAFNPTGSNANFTVAAMFRGNPCDNRVQTITGHGTNSWQLSVTTNGCLVFNAGNGNGDEGTGQNTGDIQTRGVYNDGGWHQVVAINSANAVSIYVDGKLDTNGTPSGVTATSTIPGNSSDVLIGSDPSYTNTPAGVGRQFAGQVCEVAFFTNALSASEVQQIYNATIPVIVNTNPTNLLFSSSAGQLTLSWPADHIGWQLQSNSVGLTATSSWFTIPGSTATDQMTFTPDRTRTNVFYRMLYQP